MRKVGASQAASFGVLLKRYRRAAGLSQEELAERVGYSVGHLSRLERTARLPGATVVARLADSLQLTPTDRAIFVAAAHHSESPVAAPAAAPRREQAAIADNLPPQLTPLVGREREQALLTQLLGRDDVRLLTLTGPGGVGKTRLAIQVAGSLRSRFHGGVCFVSLASVRDPALVLSTLAQELGIREYGGQALWEAVRTHLQGRQLLLLLDNFEHVLAAAPQVADLVAACPPLKVLVTSRSLLQVYGEQQCDLPPLEVPDPGLDLGRAPALDDLRRYTAVELFTQRARAIQPTFELTPANAATVAAICRQLDGLPLALELAAARTRLLSLPMLLTRLEHRLALLTAGAQDLPERQQTLRSTLDWSYQLLSAAEQRLFRRLGVFVGGWTLEAAESICGGPGDLGLDVLAGLGSLLDKSLIQRDANDADETFFTILETTREYALDRLRAGGEAELLQRRHAGYYLALAEQAAPELTQRYQAAWFTRLSHAYDNLRAALSWMREHVQVEMGLRLAGALARFWATRGYIGEGRGWLEGLLAQADAAEVPAAVRATACFASGQLANAGGDHSQAAQRLEQSIALFSEAGDILGAVRSLNTLGGVSYDLGDLQGAAALFEQCLVQSRVAGNQGEIARALANLGETRYHLGDLAGAAACYEEALALARQAGRTDVEAYQLGDLGNVARRRGDLSRAIALHQQALALKWALGERRQIAITLEDLASSAAAAGQGERAARLLGAATALREQIGAPQPFPDRNATEHAVAHARALMGGAAWGAAFGAGYACSLDQIIVEALEQPASS